MRAKEKLCANLKKYRNERGWTQKELADKLIVDPVTVSGWETGRKEPPCDTLDRIAEVYGVSVAALFASDADDDLPIRATSQAAFLRGLCAITASDYVHGAGLVDRKEPVVAPDGTTVEDYAGTDIVLNGLNPSELQRWERSNDFYNRCRGCIALCEAFKSGALAGPDFDAAVKGLIANVAEQEQAARPASGSEDELPF